MTGFNAVNLKEVKDEAPQCALAPNLEARVADVPLDLLQSGISYYRLGPDFRLPFGVKQERQEQVYVLITGSARAKLEDEIIELKPWDAVSVLNDTMRSVEAGAEGAEIIAFGAPHAKWEQEIKTEPGWWAD